jgi:hypothetical protein
MSMATAPVKGIKNQLLIASPKSQHSGLAFLHFNSLIIMLHCYCPGDVELKLI